METLPLLRSETGGPCRPLTDRRRRFPQIGVPSRRKMPHHRIIGRAGLYLAILASTWSCRQPATHRIRPAYYYWKAVLRLDSAERARLEADTAMLLYLRFFDVDWSPAGPVPVAPLRVSDTLPAGLPYVPVVFVTTDALEKSTPLQLDSLAGHILEKIRSLAEAIPNPYHAVQIDCDWTVPLRERYFRLLDTLRERLHDRGRSLTVTLRLHQIKYREQTGVPPSDRGMLMAYNTGDWKRPSTANSLYDPEVIGRYLGRLPDYPLPLDLALPVMRWTIVYRKGRFLTYLNTVAADTLKQMSFLEPLADARRFRVRADTFAFGCRLRTGDELRSEYCSISRLLEGKRMVLRRLTTPRLTLAIFHLDENLLKHYSHAEIQKIFSAVQ